MGRVVVLGNFITDPGARAPRLPEPGESLIGDNFATFLGGKGINQAVAAVRLGAKVSMIGRVGADVFGDAFFPVLTKEGIQSKYVERDTTVGKGVSVIMIAADSGQNMIVATLRANLAVPAETVVAALETLQAQHSDGTTIFLAQCETSKASYVAGLQHAHTLGMMTILNAAPIPREPLDDDLLALVDILVINETEASLLTGIAVNSSKTAQRAAEVLLLRGPRHVVTTLGAQGCLWSTYTTVPGTSSHQALPAYQVKAIDTTAAGDAFCGALAASLADGIPMQTALQRASAAGAVAATRMGAIASLPTAAEVEDLL